MNSQLKIKFIQHFSRKANRKGFTLIELLVVVIIIGILAAIALPNLLGQVAKGRQAEAKNDLGALNRAQQAYRLEEATFAQSFTELPVKLSWQYYQSDFYDIPDDNDKKIYAVYYAKALPNYQDDVLDYAAGTMQKKNGDFKQIICEELFLNKRQNLIPDFAITAGNLQVAPDLLCHSSRSKEINK